MKTQFLANMSHDIRTPLNAILGFNEVILRTTKEAEVKDYALNIQSAGKTLKDIINSILDITKIESGKLTIYSSPYSITKLLDHILNICEALATKKGLHLVFHIDEILPTTLIGEILSPEEYNNLLLKIKEAAQNFDMGAFINFEKIFSTLVVPADKIDEFKKIKELVINAAFTELTKYLAPK